MSLQEALPPSWREVLAEEFDKEYFAELEAFLEEERDQHTIYPPAEDVFNAFQFTPYEEVDVLLLGQDPYHGPDQAHGLSFSVRHGVRQPPSLRNIFKELEDDLGHAPPSHGNLEPWAHQGVMLLNTVLTVRQGEAASHKGEGWEQFTDAVIEALDERDAPLVFLLWGNHAKKKKKKIDTDRHVVIESSHPSPLSARYSFFGSKPFSQINAALTEMGRAPIDWELTD
jgi:uracil-DNA glycosylase